MKHFRFAVFACVATTALAFAGTALATPKLIIGGLTGLGTAQTSIQFTEAKEDAAPARISIYAPTGYTGTVTAGAGTQLGTVHADLQALAISPDAIIQADGTITAADPAANTNNACSPGLHTAVWNLNVTVSGQSIVVPVYVDAPVPSSDPLGAGSPIRMVFCFSSPYVPTTAGGAPFGAKIINAKLTLNQGTVTTPVASGTYPWRLVVTPYQAGGATPNAAGTVEARGIVKAPPSLTMNVVVTNKKKRIVVVTGNVRAGGEPFAGATVVLSRGGKLKGKTQPYNLGTNAKLKSGATGSVRFTLKFKKKGTVYFQLSTVVADSDVTATGCQPATPGVPCVSATQSGFRVYSRLVKLVIK